MEDKIYVNQINKKNIKTISNLMINRKKKKIIYLIGLSLAFIIITFDDNLNNYFEYKKDNDKILSKSSNKTPKNIFLFKGDDDASINIQKIHIAMALDNNIVYPTLVSMTSACSNNDKKNILVYHLLLSHNFNKSNINILETLKIDYLVIINYYIIPPRFSRLRKWRSGTECIYYKLLLPLILPTVKRIIYLDCDTLVYRDLSEMYNLDFHGNYVLGYPFHNPHILDKWGIRVINHINAGVILINIEKIINENKDFDLLQYVVKNNRKLFFLEQDAINLFFHNYIGLLPLKYGIYLFGNITIFRKKIKKNLRVQLNETELIEAIENPAIVHCSCCYPKFWSRSTYNCFGDTFICDRFNRDFYFFAKKTKFFQKVYNLYMK
jgi:lipopolysaccharide biosynthesis glycosyltransferase